MILRAIGYDIENSSDLIQIALENNNRLQIISRDYSYLDSLLSHGIPAVVGVNHTLNYGFNEGTTEHYVVVVEKNFDEQGLFYRFLDVGKKNGDNKELKFRLSGNRLTYQKYTVSQIRKLKLYGRNTTRL